MADAAAQRPAAATSPRGRIGPTLLAFALPTLASSILQSLNGTVNAIWVGRFLGENALAATSNANIVMFLLMAFVFGFGMAATILDRPGLRAAATSTSARRVVRHRDRRLPAGRDRRSRSWAGSSRRRCSTCSETPADGDAARARLSARDLPRHAGDAAADHADDGAARRGRRLTPLWFMLVAVVLDSGLNPVFILGLGPAPRLGIAGSATATLIANYVSAHRPARLHLFARPAAAAARRGAALSWCPTAPS